MAKTRDWPEYMAGRPYWMQSVWGEDGYGAGWSDRSWNSWVVSRQFASGGLTGKPALCARVSPNVSGDPPSHAWLDHLTHTCLRGSHAAPMPFPGI